MSDEWMIAVLYECVYLQLASPAYTSNAIAAVGLDYEASSEVDPKTINCLH